MSVLPDRVAGGKNYGKPGGNLPDASLLANITTVGRPAWTKQFQAAVAIRRFSELLRTVKQGRGVIVTSHGKPVAKFTPVLEDEWEAERPAPPFRAAPDRTSRKCRPLNA